MKMTREKSFSPPVFHGVAGKSDIAWIDFYYPDKYNP